MAKKSKADKAAVEVKRPEQKLLRPIRGGIEVQLNTEVISRHEALKRGLVLYWNGIPCDKGHVSPRYAKSGHCKKCYQMFRGEEIDQKQISKDKLPKHEREVKNVKTTTVEEDERTAILPKRGGDETTKGDMRRTIGGVSIPSKKRSRNGRANSKS